MTFLYLVLLSAFHAIPRFQYRFAFMSAMFAHKCFRLRIDFSLTYAETVCQRIADESPVIVTHLFSAAAHALTLSFRHNLQTAQQF